MKWHEGFILAALLAAPAQASPAAAAYRSGLGLELWTDRGNDAVYRPGQAMQIRVRASEDVYLLVYEIDAEGAVRSLFPDRGSRGFMEGRRTYEIPPDGTDAELVVEGPVGQGYIVAIASREPLRAPPWYLRPYDAQAEGVGYEGEPDEPDDGMTAEGRIVGDPFVAMERIRRRMLRSPDDESSFASAYTSYYVHHQVRYPRYICSDCHRPGRWAWWDGFDPYYATCSVFDFRVNWGWTWGPGYWFGSVPYYYYVVRSDCPPRYRVATMRTWYSSWDGWRRWRTLWGSRLTRYKSDPPSGYVPPKFKDGGVWRDDSPAPPGFLTRGTGERVRYRPTDLRPQGRGGRSGGAAAEVSPETRRRESARSTDPRDRRDQPWIIRPEDRRPEGRRRPDSAERVERPRPARPPGIERTPSREDRGAVQAKEGRKERVQRDDDSKRREPPKAERPREERRREERPAEPPRQRGERSGRGGR